MSSVIRYCYVFLYYVNSPYRTDCNGSRYRNVLLSITTHSWECTYLFDPLLVGPHVRPQPKNAGVSFRAYYLLSSNSERVVDMKCK